jgi:hypothetical protein
MVATETSQFGSRLKQGGKIARILIQGGTFGDYERKGPKKNRTRNYYQKNYNSPECRRTKTFTVTIDVHPASHHTNLLVDSPQHPPSRTTTMNKEALAMEL